MHIGEGYNILQAFSFFSFLSNCLLVIMPLSISDLSIEGSMLIISLETPDGYCFVGLLTIELFTLNNDNPEDIKPFTACSPNKTFLTLIANPNFGINTLTW